MQKKALAALAAVTLLAAGHATAQPETTGFYAGAGVGYGVSPNNIKEGTTFKFDTQNSAASVRGFAGYRINGSLAVEAQVTSLGKVQHKSNDPQVNSLTIRSTMLGGVSALAIAPAGESTEFFVRVGTAAMRLQAQDGNGKLTRNTIVPWLGVGAQHNITQNLFARVDYQFLGKAKIEKYMQSNHTAGLSIGYRF